MPKAAGPTDRPSRTYRESKRYRAEAKALAVQVRALRQERGLTLEQAAEAAQMDLKHWQKVEAATVNVTLVTLARIAEGLRVEVRELFEAPARKR